MAMKLGFVFFVFYLVISSVGFAQSCPVVFEPKFYSSKKLDKTAINESEKAFLKKSYNELNLLSPVRSKLETDLVYVEALGRSILGENQNKNRAFKKIDRSEVYNLLKNIHEKKVFDARQLTDAFETIVVKNNSKNGASYLFRNLTWIQSREQRDAVEFLAKLWVDPLVKVFTERGYQNRSFNNPATNLRNYFSSSPKHRENENTKFQVFLRTLQSAIFNSITLSSSGVFSDAYNLKTYKYEPLVKQEEYLSISLGEILRRYQQKYARKNDKDHFASSVTKITRVVAVAVLTAKLSMTHLPYEYIYMSRLQVEEQIILMQKEKNQGALTLDQYLVLKEELRSLDSNSLIERRRRLMDE